MSDPFKWFTSFFQKKSETSLRETIEELIEENQDPRSPLQDERTYLINILKLNELRVFDIMVPRADIHAIDIDMPMDDIFQEFIKQGHSRLPIFKKTLDDAIGMIHIKDLMAFFIKQSKTTRNKRNLKSIIRPLMIIAPSMPVVDLLVKMQKERLHMALVVDEYGGIDGLVTIEDIVEEIVGEIEDEHDTDISPTHRILKNHSMIADSRVDTEIFENHFNIDLSKEDDFEDVDTIGGLVFSIAGRIPLRGEILKYDFQTKDKKTLCLEFKILEADIRKIKQLKISASKSD